jgi:hypothetical protein
VAIDAIGKRIACRGVAQIHRPALRSQPRGQEGRAVVRQMLENQNGLHGRMRGGVLSMIGSECARAGHGIR